MSKNKDEEKQHDDVADQDWPIVSKVDPSDIHFSAHFDHFYAGLQPIEVASSFSADVKTIAAIWLPGGRIDGEIDLLLSYIQAASIHELETENEDFRNLVLAVKLAQGVHNSGLASGFKKFIRVHKHAGNVIRAVALESENMVHISGIFPEHEMRLLVPVEQPRNITTIDWQEDARSDAAIRYVSMLEPRRHRMNFSAQSQSPDDHEGSLSRHHSVEDLAALKTQKVTVKLKVDPELGVDPQEVVNAFLEEMKPFVESSTVTAVGSDSDA